MRRNFTAKFLLVFSFSVFAFTISYAQHLYVIVGTFTQETKAKKFTGYVNSKLFNANYQADNAKKYFYVYILKTINHEEAIAEAKRLQAETEFKDAWVFTGKYDSAGKPIAANTLPPKPIIDTNPPAQEPLPEPPPVAVVVDTAKIEKKPLIEEPVVAFDFDKVKGKPVKFVLKTEDGKLVDGEVHHVDFLIGRDLANYEANQYIDLLNPGKDRNPMSLVCGIFGYKEIITFLDYNDPALTEGATKDSKGAWVIPYTLERMKKGDVSVMYNVAFYKDAVIMLPPAKTELDELVSMMRDNPKYKIKIHGHCNGSHSRRIIGLGNEKNYFNVKGSSEHVGSAKELSKLRAEAVRAYLADNGIDPTRCQLFAWGALNMLVPENSNSAKLNDRIEIEIQQY